MEKGRCSYDEVDQFSYDDIKFAFGWLKTNINRIDKLEMGGQKWWLSPPQESEDASAPKHKKVSFS